jgi:Flp pilus assembly protein TadG
MKARFGGLTNQSGSVAMITAICIFVLLGCIALAMDIGHMVMVRSQLQKAADAGALAGARGLWPLVLPANNASTTRIPNCAAGESAAQITTHNNIVDGRNLSYDSEITVEVGQWNYDTRTFNAGCTENTDAVRVNTRRNGVVMLFAGIFGINTANLTGCSTAVMGPAAAVGRGNLPIAVDSHYTDPWTPIKLQLTPDNTDNAGWFIKYPDSANAQALKDIILNGTCPPLSIGDIINLQNGCDASVLSALQSLLDQNPNGIDCLLPVVDSCKFGQDQPITDFASVRITKVVSTGGDKRVEGVIIPLGENSSALPGGKSNKGGLAPPKLVS